MQDQVSPQQVKDEFFHQQGRSIRGWAIDNKVSIFQAYQVLDGKSKMLRGDAHRIAVLLGLKKGTVAQ